MTLYVEYPKDSTKVVRIDKQIKQSCKIQKSMYKNEMHFYALTVNNPKRKLRKQSELQ